MCYNKLAIARHNDYREGHEWKAVTDPKTPITITPPLVLDITRAKDLQAQMDKKTFAGVKSITVPKTCTMNIYEEKGDSKAVTNLGKNNVATDTWYHKGEV